MKKENGIYNIISLTNFKINTQKCIACKHINRKKYNIQMGVGERNESVVKRKSILLSGKGLARSNDNMPRPKEDD